jgi:hypothetical protein
MAVTGLLALLLPATSAAQQREAAFEVYGLTGAYKHGNLAVSEAWNPQWGGGLLAPLGSKWGVLVDVTTSAAERQPTVDGRPIQDPSLFIRERRVATTPSAIRIWRRDRYSIYAGGGWAWEHRRQQSRFLPIIDRGPDGSAVLGPPIESRGGDTQGALALRFGGLVSITPRTTFRAGFSLLQRYADERGSRVLEVGFGYRF